MKQSEAEFTGLHRLHHELISRSAAYIQIEAVQQKKRVHGGKSHALVAVQECVVINQRLEQRRRLFTQVVVIARLRTKYRSLQRALVAKAVDAAVLFDLVMMDGDDFSDRQVNALGHYFASFLYNSRYFRS